MDIKRYNDKYLNNTLGVDAEEMKEDLVGKDSASFYDVARDNEQNVYLIGKDDKSVVDAEMTQSDMVNYYGKCEEETR